jgi:predicted aldo/keto reductase-like oxidoreductase
VKKSSIPEFEKLFKVNIPVAEEMDYYINLLLQSKEYDYLPEAINKIESLEENLRNNLTLKKYKIDCMDYLINYISNTEAYDTFQKFDLNQLPKFQGKDLRNQYFSNHNEQYDFISLDLISANYSVLKYMFDAKNELCYDWRELCAIHDIHPAFSLSKSFRQFVFGNLNPNRSQTFQK